MNDKPCKICGERKDLYKVVLFLLSQEEKAKKKKKLKKIRTKTKH